MSHDASPGHIVLCGFMGAGKSTVGPLVAVALGRRFVDMDGVLVERLGKSIERVFAEDGEAAFRDAEGALADELARERDPLVIAAGGGMVVREANRAAFLERGHHLVHLVVDAETVVSRLADDDTRPLLQVDDPAARIAALLEARGPVYRALPVQVETHGRSPEEVAREVVERVG